MPSRRERVERSVALAIGAMPEFVRARLAKGRPAVGGVALDSRVAMLMLLAARAGQTFRPDVTPALMRRGYAHTNRTMGLRAAGNLEVRDIEIPTDTGDVAARLYRPAGST